MEIEEIASEKPEAILKTPIDIFEGMTESKALSIMESLSLSPELTASGITQLQKLYEFFISTDSQQVEINPWVVTTENELCCVDAKISIDDNAVYRQQKLFLMKKDSKASEETDPNEEKASQIGINYIGLDGNIGCMVNGAGLAMATMDMIKLKSGNPANFLDVGGGATVQQVTAAFQILKSHPSVKAILINIFGGIMRCDIIAEGIVKAVGDVGVDIPVVVRLNGNQSEKGRGFVFLVFF